MANGEDGPNKRRKTSHERLLPSGNIRGAFELHNLLRFKQNGGPQVKPGIDEFKNFCMTIQHNEDLEERQIQLKVLKQYCDEQSSSNGEELDFPDLFATWSFAAQSNNESVLSGVPAALSQFFRTISSELDFRDFGLSLCQSLLKRDQVKLFDRGLSSPKSKDFLISPCLRLLTEITSFDGGAVVGNVFSRRDILFKRLDTLLDPPPQSQDADRRRPTVRSNALRLMIALLKYLDIASKEELVAQAKTLHACFKSLSVDDPKLIKEVLSAVRRYLIDTELSRDSKKRLLNSNNLGLLANLYDYEDEPTEEGAEEYTPVRETIHDFLIHACTSNSGVYIPQTGWYPIGFNSEKRIAEDRNEIDLGLDSPYYSDDYSASVPIKNTTLSTFLQKLKPADDTLQAKLTIKVFEHAPELVADYSCRRHKPLSTPKDDAEWRGQFAFLFSVINLPVPKNCGWHDGLSQSPPPLSVVLESIIPRQMDRATLNQYLKSQDEIMNVSAARLLIAATQKLSNVTELFCTGRNELWQQGALSLRDMVAARVPAYSEIVAAVQRRSEEDFQVRESLFECMATWSLSTTPYDVGPAAQGVLHRMRTEELPGDAQASLIRQLRSIMKLAGRSKVTKWSTVIDLLAYAAKIDELKAASRDYLMPRLIEKAVLHNEAAFWALLASLESSPKSGTTAVLLYLENCITRVAKQPVKYLDKVEDNQKQIAPKGDASLLACCLAEQWAYARGDEALHIGLFAAKLFACLETIGEDGKVLDHLRQVFSTSADISDEIKKLKQEPPQVDVPIPVQEVAQGPEKAHTNAPAQPVDLSTTFPPHAPIPTSLKGLTRWDKVDFESELHAPSTSRLASLILSLSSPSEEIRLSAHQTLLTLMHQVHTSTYSEKDQLYLLLGELTESSHSHALSSPSTPLPTLIPSLAIFLLSIITTPSDPLYSTANRFLLRAPTWTPFTRLIPYWTNVLLLSEPESDDPAASYLAANRYLDFLISGLRTAADMDLYRKSGVFERVCSLYLAPATRRDTRTRILQLVHQAIIADGGADTLITRVGIRAWFKIVRGREGRSELGRIVQALEVELEGRKGKEYIEGWEKARPILKRKEQEREQGQDVEME